MKRAGIDPGITGALALVDVDSGELLEVVDMPLLKRKNGRNEVNAPHLIRLLVTWGAPVVLEQVGGIPGQGGPASFQFGDSFGVARTAVLAAGLPLERVAPSAWKGRAGLTGTAKGYCRTRASELWPAWAASFVRKKDDGRADAALIARFGGTDK